MKSSIRKLVSSLQNIDTYFRQGKKEIAEKNKRLLHLTSRITFSYLLLFFLITPAIFPGWHITIFYWVFLFADLFFFVLDIIFDHLPSVSAGVVTTTCILYYAVILVCCILIDVIPLPQTVSTFFPIIMVVLPCVFILPFSAMLPLQLSTEIFFCLLSVFRLDNPIAKANIFHSLAGFVASLVVACTVMDLRANDNNAKYDYMRKSMFDSLTRILNRSECESQIRSYLMMNMPKAKCAMMILDVDKFKQINDQKGHQAGDEILRSIGAVLRSRFRSSDIVGRLGGDEFLVFLRGNLEDRSIIQIATQTESLIMGLSDDFPGILIACSIGIAKSSGNSDFDELYRAADQAMYESKRRGPGNYTIRRIS